MGSIDGRAARRRARERAAWPWLKLWLLKMLR
jgi:hypothetical protein